MRMVRCVLLCLLLLTLAGCDEPGEATPAPASYEVVAPEAPVARGSRRFGINISEGSEGFAAAFAAAQEAGVQVVELNLPWDAIETRPGKYKDPWGLLAAIAFYGEHDVGVALSLGVIDTVARTTPAYLDDLPYDDPQVIAAFNAMVDWVMQAVPESVTVPSISVGNEVDLFLEGDDWAAYTAFYRAAASHIQANYPEVKVGVKITVMRGLMAGDLVETVQALNRHSDVVMLNYYPQDGDFQVLPPEIVHEHFDTLVGMFPGREIWLTEVGYQSGSQHCGSSEAQQAAFFHELFAAWDAHAGSVRYVLVDWLHDQSPQQIAEWEDYYGSDAPAFVEYLSTLGLRHYDHTAKAAWWQVLAETQARGWGE